MDDSQLRSQALHLAVGIGGSHVAEILANAETLYRFLANIPTPQPEPALKAA